MSPPASPPADPIPAPDPTIFLPFTQDPVTLLGRIAGCKPREAFPALIHKLRCETTRTAAWERYLTKRYKCATLR